MQDSLPNKTGHDRFDVALGLRALAELLEASPKMPVPDSTRAQLSIIDGDEATRIAEVERYARLLGIDTTRDKYGVRARLHLVGGVSFVVFASTAESSYSGAVQP